MGEMPVSTTLAGDIARDCLARGNVTGALKAIDDLEAQILDFNIDPEDCGACAVSPGVCPYHEGLNEGFGFAIYVARRAWDDLDEKAPIDPDPPRRRRVRR